VANTTYVPETDQSKSSKFLEKKIVDSSFTEVCDMAVKTEVNVVFTILAHYSGPKKK